MKPFAKPEEAVTIKVVASNGNYPPAGKAT
jgi:hypothetical protein